MMKFSLVSAILGLANSALAATPVVGGQTVSASDVIATRTVALFFVEQGSDGQQHQGLCTGSILDESRILTAAHCVHEFQSGLVIFSPNGVLPIVKLYSQGDASAQKITRKIASVKEEPGYDPNAGGDEEFNDLAIVNFTGGLPSGYEPAKFLSKSNAMATIQSGGAITLSGYGITRPNSQTGVGVLRKVDRKFQKFSENQIDIWVNGSAGHDACSGDSGGPAMVQSGGEVYVVGVASRSDCVKSSIYTLVDESNLP